MPGHERTAIVLGGTSGIDRRRGDLGAATILVNWAGRDGFNRLLDPPPARQAPVPRKLSSHFRDA